MTSLVAAMGDTAIGRPGVRLSADRYLVYAMRLRCIVSVPAGDTAIGRPGEGFPVRLSADEQWVAVLAGDNKILVWSMAQLEDYGDAAQVMEVVDSIHTSPPKHARKQGHLYSPEKLRCRRGVDDDDGGGGDDDADDDEVSCVPQTELQHEVKFLSWSKQGPNRLM
jgi:hypothetical protein